MSAIHLRRSTTSTPEQFVAGLTDFGPGRSKLFGTWERLHYDWSDPNHVALTTTDSNV
jgi:hypothetical protein